MSAFTFDTSGEVPCPGFFHKFSTIPVRWSDIDPFTQGYVTAALRDAASQKHAETLPGARARIHYPTNFPAFSDLHPETLAAMMKDCARLLELYAGGYRDEWLAAHHTGAAFWEGRQAGRGGYPRDGFPPVTLSLSDDGTVRQRPAESRAGDGDIR